ncbi:hypothetical protein A2U01_0081050 [Trifolium medium]|uniref:Uncharacterized protein n=1 Tax=Trifolium medium TaxID=97028 RepID=A0A392TIP8_9FABA|nr:hypothetical protein [Trifolium medium]
MSSQLDRDATVRVEGSRSYKDEVAC